MGIKEQLGHAKQLHEHNGEKQKEINDKLAQMVKDDFMVAARHRNISIMGEDTVNSLLLKCHDQYYGVIPADIREAFPNMPAVNLTQLKVSALNAWIRDLLFGSGGTPFTVEPTPIPELNSEIEEEVLGLVKEALFGGVEPPPQDNFEMKKLVSRKKKLVREGLELKAKDACQQMEKLMWDQCIDGGYKKAIMEFLNDVCIYPYAVIEGPIPEIRTQYVWQGNKLVSKNEVVYATNRVSPFDFFWSPDSTNTQDGSYIIVRKRYSRKQLYKMAQMKSYISANVIAALEYFADHTTNMNWCNDNPEDNTFIPWDGKAALEVLKYYGTVRGDVLKEYGLTGIEDKEYYDCIIYTLAHFTLKVIINPNPNASIRPIHVTSYEKTGKGIVGFGIAQKIRDVERAFQSCLRGMLKNMEFSSGPIGEVDFSRIAQWIDDDEVGDIEPYTVNPVDPDPTNGGRNAYNFHNFPNNTASLSNVCQWFMSLADVVTQIPASIHGQPVGTGANRTFRGMSMLYGNALKGVQSGITNVDEDVVSPFAQALYMLNLKYHPDESVKGDAKVLARGASGLMEKELKKNDVLESAQVVASLAQSGQVDPKVLGKAVSRVLEVLDLVDYDVSEYLQGLIGVPSEVDTGQPQGSVDPNAMQMQGHPPQGSPEQMAQAQSQV